mgnify:CR=1 FL=1
MNFVLKFALAAVLGYGGAAGLFGCDRDKGRAEEVGESIDRGADRVDRKAEDVGEKIDRKAEDVGEKIDRKAEDIGDAVEDATDRDRVDID